MTEFEELAAVVLSKCGRHCCICRRFEPLHLQVHHIQLKSEGGEDSLDNLIAICITCHSDVHAELPFTRRFTHEELKLHRERTYELVESGKLYVPSTESRIDREMTTSPQMSSILSDSAQMILLNAAQTKTGEIIMSRTSEGILIQVGTKPMCTRGDARDEARAKSALKELVDGGFVEPEGTKGQLFVVTNEGYVMADKILATAQGGSHIDNM